MKATVLILVFLTVSSFAEDLYVEETGENYFRKSPNLDQVEYHHLALLLKKQDEVPVDEETVRKAIESVAAQGKAK